MLNIGDWCVSVLLFQLFYGVEFFKTKKKVKNSPALWFNPDF